MLAIHQNFMIVMYTRSSKSLMMERTSTMDVFAQVAAQVEATQMTNVGCSGEYGLEGSSIIDDNIEDTRLPTISASYSSELISYPPAIAIATAIERLAHACIMIQHIINACMHCFFCGS